MASLLFATFHAYPDTASGAAISAHDLFALLRRKGWDVRVFSGPQQDRPGISLFESLRKHHRNVTTRSHSAFRVHHFRDDEIPVTAYDISPPTTDQLRLAFPFLLLLEANVRANRPDLMLVYGGGWLGRAILALAKHHRIPAVFWLRNHAYAHKDMFDDAASICVASEFTRDFYRERLGINAVAITPPILSERIICPQREPRFVTMINPIPPKGVVFFAGIVRELHRTRPDIPVIVVESRAGAENLKALHLPYAPLADHSADTPEPFVRVHPNTRDPRDFYRLTKILLVPSLWNEAFGRVVAEAQLSGIPVLSSTRGGLRQTVGEGGFLFEIPPQYTPESTIIPPAADVAPWVETIIRLHDIADEYAVASDRALRAAQRFQEPEIAAKYDDYLRSLISPANPPTESALPAIVRRISPFLAQPPKIESLPKIPADAIGHLLD